MSDSSENLGQWDAEESEVECAECRGMNGKFNELSAGEASHINVSFK